METMKLLPACRETIQPDMEPSRASRLEPLGPELYVDLLGVPFVHEGRSVEGDGGLDCLGVQLIIWHRLGFDISDPAYQVPYPEDWAHDGAEFIREGLADSNLIEIPFASLLPGDLVVCSWYGKTEDHVAIYRGGHRAEIIHSLKLHGVCVSRLTAARKTGKVLGYWRHPARVPAARLQRAKVGPPRPAPILRPREVHVPRRAIEGATETSASSNIRVVVLRDPLKRPQDAETIQMVWREGLVVRDVVKLVEGVPEEYCIVNHNGARVAMEDWDRPLAPGDGIGIAVCPWGEGVTIGQVILAIVLSVLSAVVNATLAPDLEAPENPAEIPSPTFDISGLRNTARPGLPIPVLYGTHRVAGNFMQVFFTTDNEGRSILFVQVAISEGPIQSIGGFTVDSDEQQGPLLDTIDGGFEINGNPASSFNAAVSIRLGNSFQETMPGFRNITIGVPYDVTLLVDGQGFIHSTDTDIEEAEVVVTFPGGLYNFSPNGSIGGRTVTFQVRWTLVGSGVTVSAPWSVTGVRRGQFSASFKIRNLVRGRYEIEVERLTPPWPETQSDKESKSVLVTVNEITLDALTHPGIAMTGWKITATDQISGGVPTLTHVADGRIIHVWDGVDPLIPIFARQFSNNPAWCVMDMILHPLYGLNRGGELTLNEIDLEAFLEWADHCDMMVADGRGGMIKRAVFDMVWDKLTTGWDAITSAAKSHWAFPVPVGKTITVVVDKTKSPINVIAMGNVADWTVQYLGRADRKNSVDVEYPNEEIDYESDVATRRNDADIALTTEPLRADRVALIGVTRPPQAYRYSQFRLNHHNLVNVRGSFRAGIDTLHHLPGDVVLVQHDAMSWGISGRTRADSPTSTQYRCDKTLVVAAAGVHKITARTNGTGAYVLQERTVLNAAGTYPPGSAIGITPAWDGGDFPKKGDPFVFGIEVTYRKQARLLVITTEEDFSRRIAWDLYVAAKYSDDPGVVETFTDVLPHRHDLPGEAKFFSIEEVHSRAKDGTIIDSIRVYFLAKRPWEHVDVWTRHRDRTDSTLNDIPFSYAGTAKGDEYIIQNVGAGDTLEVSITPSSPSGFRLQPRSGQSLSIHIFGDRRYPPDPTGTAFESVQENLVIRAVCPVDGEHVRGVEVRYGITWAGSRRIGKAVPFDSFLPGEFIDAQTVRVKALTRAGMKSDLDDSKSVESHIPDDYMDTQTTYDPGFAAVTKVDTFVDSSELILSDTKLTGTGVIDSGTLATNEPRRLWNTVQLGIRAATLLQLDDCTFTINSARASRLTLATGYLDGSEGNDVITIENAGFEIDADIAKGLTLDNRPYEIEDALEPLVDFRTSENGGSLYTAWEPFLPCTRMLNRYQIRITLNRPNERYTPRIVQWRVTHATVSMGLSIHASSPPASLQIDGQVIMRSDLEQAFFWEATRAHWLGLEFVTVQFGTSGTVDPAVYLNLSGGVQGSSTVGWNIPFNGVVVGYSFTQAAAVSGDWEIMQGGSLLASFDHNFVEKTDLTLDVDISSSRALAVRNKDDASTVTDPVLVLYIRRKG